MNRNNCQLDQGVLLVLDRDRAKEIFAAREPANLLEFIKTQAGDGSLVDAGFVLDLQGSGDRLQNQLVDPALTSDDLRPVLEATLLGGRPLADEQGFQVRLVRPDLVRQIASALDTIDGPTFAAQWPESADQSRNVIAELDSIRQLYRRAAEARAAVVFARVQNHE